jgi:hypothetical protein
MNQEFYELRDPAKKKMMGLFEQTNQVANLNKKTRQPTKKITADQNQENLFQYHKQNTKIEESHDFRLILEVIEKGALEVSNRLKQSPDERPMTVDQLDLEVWRGCRKIAGINGWAFGDEMYLNYGAHKARLSSLVQSHLLELQYRVKGTPEFEFMKLWSSFNESTQRKVLQKLMEQTKIF